MERPGDITIHIEAKLQYLTPPESKAEELLREEAQRVADKAFSDVAEILREQWLAGVKELLGE